MISRSNPYLKRSPGEVKNHPNAYIRATYSLDMDTIPKHIAIILDGNRRYAKEKGISLEAGHEAGAKNLSNLITWAYDAGVGELSLYCFSTENFTRPKQEVEYLLGLFRKQLQALEREKRMDQYDVRIHFAGDLSLFPQDIQERMLTLMEKTINRKEYRINFCMGYGGRQEILHAVKEIVKAGILPDKISPEIIKSHLWEPNDPDLVIRPGGEHRSSNFLLWQSHYSEWHFSDKYWPEFSKEDFLAAIEDYGNRKRRFGG